MLFEVFSGGQKVVAGHTAFPLSGNHFQMLLVGMLDVLGEGLIRFRAKDATHFAARHCDEFSQNNYYSFFGYLSACLMLHTSI